MREVPFIFMYILYVYSVLHIRKRKLHRTKLFVATVSIIGEGSAALQAHSLQA
jgi:hypothetical protein